MRVACTFAIALALVVVGPVPVGAASKGTTTRTFTGEFFREPGSHVRLVVKLRDGRPVGGTFKATNLLVACEGIPLDDRASFPKARIRFLDHDTFTADRYDDGSSSGTESYVHVKAGLDQKDHEAVGSMIAFRNPVDDSTAPECGTRSWADWQVR